MITRTARTLTAVSALVLGFGPAAVQAADANNTPYAKYVDCGSFGQRTSCVERGEVMNFAQLNDIITAAMYREAMERRRQSDPDSDPIDRMDDSTTILPGDRPASGNPEETTEGPVIVPPTLVPASPVVVRYERGIDDQSTESSRLVFTVRDETGESSSYSVNVSPETGRYIENEIIRTAEPTTRTPVPTTRTPVPIVRTSETPSTATEMEVAAPLDMQEVFVSQEMVPVIFNSEALVAASVAVAASPSSPAQPTAAPLPQTTVQAEIQPAPAPSGPTVTYTPPAQISIMQTSVDTQPVSVYYYTYQPQQPVTPTSYTFTMQGTTETVTASPVITVRLEQEPSDQTITITARNANESTITVRPYVIMVSAEETVHVVPQQVEAPNNVLAVFRDNSSAPIGATPGENVRDQSYSGTNETSPTDNSSPSPSNDGGDDDGGDDDGGDDDDGPGGPIN